MYVCIYIYINIYIYTYTYIYLSQVSYLLNNCFCIHYLTKSRSYHFDTFLIKVI